MTKEAKYNGYKNYETWCVALWLENDQSNSEYWREQARRQTAEAPHANQVKAGDWTVEKAAKFRLADQLQAEFEEANPLDKADVWSDLLNAALDAVDWHEVAEQFLCDFLPTEKDDDPQPANPCANEETPILPVIIDSDGGRFPLGMLVITPGAMQAVPPPEASAAISRHLRGDWGLVCADDAQENERSLAAGARLLSAYDTASGQRFWIITEADRSVTTVLLPDEY